MIRSRLLAVALAGAAGLAVFGTRAETGSPVATTVAENPASQRPTPTIPYMKGVVVSCPRAGQIWGSQEMVRSLRSLKSLGVEWVAIHPYARVNRDGSIRSRPARETEYLDRAVGIARTEGVRLFWKPHLAYWGSFAWRGTIEFGDDKQAWQRFFTDYRIFIMDQARFAERAGIEILAVGVEYEATTHHEAAWREIIQDVRSVYNGRLTYAANWDAMDKVPFWDAVDLIGVHAYFPLSEEDEPSEAELRAAWEEPLSKLRALSENLAGKPVLFAEIGYNRSPDAARRPWDDRIQDSPAVRALRERLLNVALTRLEQEPLIRGVFWWKWIPGPGQYHRDFSMRDEEAMAALRRHWREPEIEAGR